MSKRYVRYVLGNGALVFNAVYEHVDRCYAFIPWIPCSGDWVCDENGKEFVLGPEREGWFELLPGGKREDGMWHALAKLELSGDRGWKPVLDRAPGCVAPPEKSAGKHYVRYLPLHPHTLVTGAVYEVIAIESLLGLDRLEVHGADEKLMGYYHKTAFENPWVPATGDIVYDGSGERYCLGAPCRNPNHPRSPSFVRIDLVPRAGEAPGLITFTEQSCWKPLLGCAPNLKRVFGGASEPCGYAIAERAMSRHRTAVADDELFEAEANRHMSPNGYPLSLDTPIGPKLSPPDCPASGGDRAAAFERERLRALCYTPTHPDGISAGRSEVEKAPPPPVKVETTYGSCRCCGEGEPGRKRNLTDGLCAWCHGRIERDVEALTKKHRASDLRYIEWRGRPGGQPDFKGDKVSIAMYRALMSEPEKKRA